jgi:hypothetical protein
LEKFLEITGIRLSSEVFDLVGASLRATLTPVIDGKHDRAVLAWLAEGTWAEKSRHRPEALAGRFIDTMRLPGCTWNGSIPSLPEPTGSTRRRGAVSGLAYR